MNSSATDVNSQSTPIVSPKWPMSLWVVRHGQSAGNVARDLAEAAGHPLIDIATRDMDVPLSPLGERQSAALGRWFGDMNAALRPDVVLCSPYVRAYQTAEAIVSGASLPQSIRLDERLREKEFGILDRLTVRGIHERFPDLADQRKHVGKFYFRPPGGESWCDVILRLRSFLETVTREHNGQRVLIVAHQVIVNCLRYLLERMDERTVLDVDRQGDVPNCGVTAYDFDAAVGRQGKLVLRLANFVSPVSEAGEQVTAEPDIAAAPKA